MNMRSLWMDQSYDCAEELLTDPRIVKIMARWEIPVGDTDIVRGLLATAHARGRTEGICWASLNLPATTAPADSTLARPETPPTAP